MEREEFKIEQEAGQNDPTQGVERVPESEHLPSLPFPEQYAPMPAPVAETQAAPKQKLDRVTKLSLIVSALGLTTLAGLGLGGSLKKTEGHKPDKGPEPKAGEAEPGIKQPEEETHPPEWYQTKTIFARDGKTIIGIESKGQRTSYSIDGRTRIVTRLSDGKVISAEPVEDPEFAAKAAEAMAQGEKDQHPSEKKDASGKSTSTFSFPNINIDINTGKLEKDLRSATEEVKKDSRIVYDAAKEKVGQGVHKVQEEAPKVYNKAKEETGKVINNLEEKAGKLKEEARKKIFDWLNK